MTDARGRERERAAAHDPTARVAWLTEWLRTDPACEMCGGTKVTESPLAILGDRVYSKVPCFSCVETGGQRRWRVHLAAFCGDEAARAAAPRWWERRLLPERRDMSVASWLSELDHWNVAGQVHLRSAVAAARAALGS